MTSRRAKKEIKSQNWIQTQVIHEKGIMRIQCVTKKGKPRTLTVDR